jgi:GNAT superfamily N-acetyltransferase
VVEIAPLTSERWPDFLDLLERRGPRGGRGPIHCCCMWWRERGRSHSANRSAMEGRVRAGEEPGLLAYVDGRSVGWVSVAPGEQYGQLLRSRTYGSAVEEEGVWAIVCFYVDPRERRSGAATALLEAGVERAARGGATAVVGFPHARVRGDYMGSASAFARAGFEPVAAAGPRTVVRYEVTRRR